MACSAATDGVITSGGGFSVYYPQPSYQSSVVQQYLNANITFPSSKQFNPSGRAYPGLFVSF